VGKQLALQAETEVFCISKEENKSSCCSRYGDQKPGHMAGVARRAGLA